MKSLTSHWAVKETKQKTSEILADCKKLFKVWTYYDDTQLDRDFPPPKKLTTRYFKKNVEADEEQKEKSANDLEKEGVEAITLRERLLLELKHFDETKSHLDIENWTLCAGSRYAGGGVPSVRWYSDDHEFYVGWGGVDDSDSRLRARVAVNPSDFPLEHLGSDLKVRVEVLETNV